MEALVSAAPARGRGRGRGSLSYLSLQQSLDNLPPPALTALIDNQTRESQFEDAPGAYPRLASQSPTEPLSPQLSSRQQQQHQQQQQSSLGPFSTPPPPTSFSTPPPPSTPTPPPNAGGFVSPPPPTPPPSHQQSPPPFQQQQQPPLPQQQQPPLPQQQQRPTTPPEVVVRNAAKNKSSPGDLFDKLKPYFPDGAEDVARSIHAICIEDRAFSQVAAQTCQCLTHHDQGGAEFRGFLLRGLQSDFKNRATIFEKSESDFLSCVTLLCGVFAEMRDRSGMPLLPLATPVVEYLSMMLQDFSLTNDASLVLAQNLTLVGPILREKAQDKEQALIESVRQKILDGKTESLTRCLLLRVLESSSSSWQPLPNSVVDFYEATLANLQRVA